MVSVPRGPGDRPRPPEEPHVRIGGEGTSPLILQALDEIEALKRSLVELVKRFEALEHRVATLETPKA